MPFEVSQLFCSEVSELADTFSLKLRLFSEISELADAISLKFQSLPMLFSLKF